MIVPFCLLLLLTAEMWSSTVAEELFNETMKSTESHEKKLKTKERVCSYQDVLDYLNLTADNPNFTMTRPVFNHRNPNLVLLNVAVYAILDVRESDQTLIAYIWVQISWINDFTTWDPKRFCGISQLIVPAKSLWKPDIIIEEMVEKDNAPPSHYVDVFHRGRVVSLNDQVIISTCKMDVRKFPFDVQRCHLTFKSNIHSDQEIDLLSVPDAWVKEQSIQLIRTQYEWLLDNIDITEAKTDFEDFNQTLIIYTITMKRKSVLFVANFLLPVFFLLVLDLGSFLIQDDGGEKLSFKITVLLSVTVMQLILNEILPSSTEDVPLIVIYCIGIFGMMLLSLLETVVVNYLMRKDSSKEDTFTGNEPNIKPERQRSKLEEFIGCQSESVHNPNEPTPSLVEEIDVSLEKVSQELNEMKSELAQLRDRTEDESKGYWTRVSKKLTKVFFVFYVITSTVFLVALFSEWLRH